MKHRFLMKVNGHHTMLTLVVTECLHIQILSMELNHDCTLSFSKLMLTTRAHGLSMTCNVVSIELAEVTSCLWVLAIVCYCIIKPPCTVAIQTAVHSSVFRRKPERSQWPSKSCHNYWEVHVDWALCTHTIE